MKKIKSLKVKFKEHRLKYSSYRSNNEKIISYITSIFFYSIILILLLLALTINLLGLNWMRLSLESPFLFEMGNVLIYLFILSYLCFFIWRAILIPVIDLRKKARRGK
jgi:hypothetical protein